MSSWFQFTFWPGENRSDWSHDISISHNLGQYISVRLPFEGSKHKYKGNTYPCQPCRVSTFFLSGNSLTFPVLNSTKLLPLSPILTNDWHPFSTWSQFWSKYKQKPNYLIFFWYSFPDWPKFPDWKNFYFPLISSGTGNPDHAYFNFANDNGTQPAFYRQVCNKENPISNVHIKVIKLFYDNVTAGQKFCALTGDWTLVSRFPGKCYSHQTDHQGHLITVTFTLPRRKYVLMHFKLSEITLATKCNSGSKRWWSVIWKNSVTQCWIETWSRTTWVNIITARPPRIPGRCHNNSCNLNTCSRTKS